MPPDPTPHIFLICYGISSYALSILAKPMLLMKGIPGIFRKTRVANVRAAFHNSRDACRKYERYSTCLPFKGPRDIMSC